MVTLATVIPDFKNVRLLTFYALAATTFTTWWAAFLEPSPIL